jgi:hypothetical protein
MRADQARTIPIDRNLYAQGVKPARARMGGRELWYSSPLRQGDKSPSFKTDTLKNLWYDHGLGRGGNIIDLVTHLVAGATQSLKRFVTWLSRTLIAIASIALATEAVLTAARSDVVTWLLWT